MPENTRPRKMRLRQNNELPDFFRNRPKTEGHSRSLVESWGAQKWGGGSLFASDVGLAARGERCRAFTVLPLGVSGSDQVEGEG